MLSEWGFTVNLKSKYCLEILASVIGGTNKEKPDVELGFVCDSLIEVIKSKFRQDFQHFGFSFYVTLYVACPVPSVN